LDLAALAHSQDRQEAAGTHLTEAHALFRNLKVPQYVERTQQLANEYGFPILPPGTDITPGQFTKHVFSSLLTILGALDN
jgi:hypothetical protein